LLAKLDYTRGYGRIKAVGFLAEKLSEEEVAEVGFDDLALTPSFPEGVVYLLLFPSQERSSCPLSP
jgi:hypothetical protein